MKKMDKKKTQKIVKKAYGKIARKGRDRCCSTCGPDPKKFAKSVGYSEEELKVIPEEANLALSCGNPTALANLKKGQVVLDLGSGAGFDCFLAAAKVGPHGKVIGIDMTPEMIEKAQANAQKSGAKNVEFRLGEIENLPAEDNSIDVVISNCVINLSADKPKVFKEIYRTLKPGGKIAISDMALKKELPQKIRKNIEAYVGCVGGAILIDEYKRIVEDAGFKNVKITLKVYSVCADPHAKKTLRQAISESLGKGESLDDYVASVSIEGYK